MRCFVGCFLEPRSAARLESAVPVIAGTRRVPRRNLHLTLRFLGDLDAAAAVRANAAVAALGASAIECVAAGLGGYPTPQRARVVVVRVVEVALLREWSTRLGESIESGNSPEERRFEPHVTIARARTGVRVPEVSAVSGLELTLRAPALYVSLQERSGSRYVRFGSTATSLRPSA